MPQEGETNHPIVIAGAGIGGLCAALALRRQGHEVVLLDKAARLAEVGAGLQLSPNACSVLDELGVLGDLEPHAFAPNFLQIHSARSNALLAKVPLGSFLKERHGHPYWVIHRADLQSVLLDRVSQTPGIDLRLGAEVQTLKSTPYNYLACEYRTGPDTHSLDCRALIGADGVWSKTRQLLPNHENARFSGQVAYRATLPIEQVPNRWTGDSGLWLHRDAHLVHYQIRGGRELNIVALATEDWKDETWSAAADKKALLHVFKDWPAEVRNLLALPDTWLKWALCSVNATGPWTHGHIALLGDAAHAMLPFMAQGAGMAIEDAAILGRHLPGDVANIPAALRAYERQRKSRAAHIQNRAFTNAQVFHYSGLPAMARDAVLRFSSPLQLAARFDDIYGWTPD
ncbi:FAD-dependent monooxygenase [Roseibium aggregatum]|uniref:FAD-dependent monooxygenase n=1 Tax=Roseibium aggregatum TaxID=187304 RepID=A0A939EDB8_9HYPH|nr:FAD-dependent monooxygenase [Roseibium aggregatum]MBN9671075.1 FAD-dependent monooxygenase [Roseibium aggregatum]